ncbi:cytochrome b [Stappia sp. F7233]|uniref:Cytochrome b n=1 Tax=Stappia albiluteola TaxID=2758565 RepID=A0A839A7N1_9HYPH|nr:cytochrome b [Stappia albiluteola]MBA5775533.1 cytochrome b [Stappia albiluteola]
MLVLIVDRENRPAKEGRGKHGNRQGAHLNAYTRTAILLHWLMAVPFVGLLVAGELTMGDHQSRFLPSLHASLGLVLFLLVCARLIWRFRHPAPPPVANNSIAVLGIRCAHVLLYAGMVFLPLSGWLAYTEHVRLSLGIQPARWFGYKIPLLPDFGVNWHLIHNWGGKAFMALITLHAIAAFKHHFIDRDDTLRRMLR